MKIAKTGVLEGFVEFGHLGNGAVFKLNGELWMKLKVSNKEDDNAAWLITGKTTDFDDDRLTLPVVGAFVEGYTGEGE